MEGELHPYNSKQIEPKVAWFGGSKLCKLIEEVKK